MKMRTHDSFTLACTKNGGYYNLTAPIAFVSKSHVQAFLEGGHTLFIDRGLLKQSAEG